MKKVILHTLYTLALLVVLVIFKILGIDTTNTIGD